MATKSYDTLYLSDVCENVGAMFEYAVACGYSPSLFWERFVNSVVAKQIERGNPKYLTGYSGRDFVDIVVSTQSVRTFRDRGKLFSATVPLSFTPYYWAGWALTRLQYESGYSFFQINNCLPIDKVINWYGTLHEADISKFLTIAAEALTVEKKETNLKAIRKARGLSQQKLASAAGVDLRSIQMYEQKRNDINKAQAETLLKISKILGCQIEDLLEIQP